MDFIGLDLGSKSIKLVQLSRSADLFRLVAMGSVASPQKLIESEVESDLVEWAQTIKKLTSEAKTTTRNVAIALPEDKVFTRIIEMPPMEEKEIKSAITWEAEQYIPISLEDVVLDYQIISLPEKSSLKKSEIFLVAAPKRLEERYLKLLEMSGLRPIWIETEMISLSRSLVPPESLPTLLVEIGARASDIAIVDHGQIVVSRSVPAAGEAITRALAGYLGMGESQAEEYKKAYGVDESMLEGKLLEAIGPVLNLLLREIEKVRIFYQKRKIEENVKVDRLILAGGTAGLPQLVSLFAKRLGIEVQAGNPFIRVENRDEIFKTIPRGSEAVFSVAVGLAMNNL